MCTLKSYFLHFWIKNSNIGFNFKNWCLSVFKLADRMHSMRTNGASKNRDCRDQMGPLTFVILVFLGLCIPISTNTYGMYTYGMYDDDFFWRIFWRFFLTKFLLMILMNFSRFFFLHFNFVHHFAIIKSCISPYHYHCFHIAPYLKVWTFPTTTREEAG